MPCGGSPGFWPSKRHVSAGAAPARSDSTATVRTASSRLSFPKVSSASPATGPPVSKSATSARTKGVAGARLQLVEAALLRRGVPLRGPRSGAASAAASRRSCVTWRTVVASLAEQLPQQRQQLALQVHVDVGERLVEQHGARARGRARARSRRAGAGRPRARRGGAARCRRARPGAASPRCAPRAPRPGTPRAARPKARLPSTVRCGQSARSWNTTARSAVLGRDEHAAVARDDALPEPHGARPAARRSRARPGGAWSSRRPRARGGRALSPGATRRVDVVEDALGPVARATRRSSAMAASRRPPPEQEAAARRAPRP